MKPVMLMTETMLRLADGFVSTRGRQSNDLKALLLIAIGDIGWLFLNDVLAAQLGLPQPGLRVGP